jgi:hypothetical protein
MTLQIRPESLSNDVDTDSACEDIDEDFNDEVEKMAPRHWVNLTFRQPP